MDHQINMKAGTANIVFIGGTGRCGTNILKDIFSRHSRVATLPFEHRFFIDPDGLIDFYSSYSQAWSPFWAHNKLRRLEKFLNRIAKVNKFHRLLKIFIFLFGKAGIKISPQKYCDWELKKYFPNFENHNKRLFDQLKEFSYEGLWPGIESYSFKPSIYHCSWMSKEKLAEIIRSYINKLIKEFLFYEKSDFFVEDNTWNIFFARELLEIVPQAKIIHIYRDPRDVVASSVRQRWCPSDKTKAAIWYKSMMEYWLYSVKKDLPMTSYIEIKLESLVESPERTLTSLCDFSGIPFERSMLEIDLGKSNSGRWEKEFSESEKKVISPILGPILHDLGYGE